VQSVFLHPTAAALAKLLPSPSEVAVDNSAEPVDRLTESIENGTSSKVETSTSAVLACAAPVLFFLQFLWSDVVPGLVVSITVFSAANIVGWVGILPLLFVLLFLSELLMAVMSATLLTCLKWLLVGRLRPSDASAGPQRLAFLRWRIGRIIQKELEPTFAIIRGTILQNYLLRALGTRVSSSAVIETVGARKGYTAYSLPSLCLHNARSPLSTASLRYSKYLPTHSPHTSPTATSPT